MGEPMGAGLGSKRSASRPPWWPKHQGETLPSGSEGWKPRLRQVLHCRGNGGWRTSRSDGGPSSGRSVSAYGVLALISQAAAHARSGTEAPRCGPNKGSLTLEVCEYSTWMVSPPLMICSLFADHLPHMICCCSLITWS